MKTNKIESEIPILSIGFWVRHINRDNEDKDNSLNIPIIKITKSHLRSLDKQIQFLFPCKYINNISNVKETYMIY